MLVGAILACEVAFWVLLGAGLTARYVWRRPRLGWTLLLGSPAADVALLALTAVDLHRGSAATQAHALAAVYIGFTIAFGHSLVAWADRRFAHHFAGGPPPAARTAGGQLRVRHEWREFGKATLAWAISVAILLGLAAMVDDVQRAQALLTYVGVLSVVLVIWFLTGPAAAVVGASRQLTETRHDRQRAEHHSGQ